MTESLYSQIATAEDALRESESRLGRMKGVQQSLAGLVGRAEGADGRVVVEYVSGEGLTTLELDPRAMRLPSADLAAAIRTAIREAQGDLQRQIQQTLADSGVAATMPSPEELRAQLAAAREQFIGTARTAAAGLSDAQRLLNGRTNT